MDYSVCAQKRSMRQFLIKGGYVLSFCLALLLSSCNEGATQVPVPGGHLLIVGSTALQPLTTMAATLFEKEYPQAHIEVRGGGSLVGLNAVDGQQADIGESDIYADPTLYPNPYMTDHIICIVPFAIIVNPDIPLTSLKQQQLIDIFSTGKLRNWQDLGGPDLPIVPVIRADTSGTRASFLRYVLTGKPELPHLQSTVSSQAMLALVAHIPGAIGYVALSALNTSVHTLAINGLPATPATIAAGKYAFWGYEHMYTLSTNHNPLLATFLSFMLATSVQTQARRMGYIPLTQIQLPAPTSTG